MIELLSNLLKRANAGLKKQRETIRAKREARHLKDLVEFLLYEGPYDDQLFPDFRFHALFEIFTALQKRMVTFNDIGILPSEFRDLVPMIELKTQLACQRKELSPGDLRSGFDPLEMQRFFARVEKFADIACAVTRRYT